MVEGGIYTILHNALEELSKYSEKVPLEIIAFVHKKDGLDFPSIQLIEIPKSKNLGGLGYITSIFISTKFLKKYNPTFGFHYMIPRHV